MFIFRFVLQTHCKFIKFLNLKEEQNASAPILIHFKPFLASLSRYIPFILYLFSPAETRARRPASLFS